MLTEDISVQVRKIFNAAQFGAAGHRKLIQSLRSIHDECGREGADGERDFFMSIIHCLNAVLAVKRSEEVVSKCLRFLVGFIVLSAEKDEASVMGGSSITVRFIENLMLYSLEGIDSKERLVRVRLGQIIVACVSSIDELGENVWAIFKTKMTERLFDKEAAVRVQAVHAMSRLQSLSLTENEDNGNILTVLDIFMELLSHDPSAEVRKAVLSHIEVTDRSLEAIIQRRRDVDVGVRKFFYERKMNEIDVRTLSITQRDIILRVGLRDRDSSVRRACIEMVFGVWIKTANNNLIQLLLSLDVVRNVEVAEAALKSFYEMAPDMFSSFPAVYFENLIPETAIALRVYCERLGSEQAAELLPEMSQLSNYIRLQYTNLVTSEEEVRAECEFIIGELFKAARLLDASDEVGRRVFLDLLTEMLANLEVGDQLFSQALDLLGFFTPDLNSFLQVSGQLVADLHELYSVPEGPTNDLQKSLESLSFNDQKQLTDATPFSPSEDIKIMAQLRCQELVAAAFRLPGLSLADHPVVLDLVNDVVVIAVNSPYAAIQNRGLTALGLACLLSRELAEEYLNIFVDFFTQGQDDTRVSALKIIFDLILFYSIKSAGDIVEDPFASVLDKIIISLCDQDREVQAVTVQGYSKLLLHRITSDIVVLAGLFQLYFHPATCSNTSLRQSLSYFFQAFAYSSPSNQILIASSFLSVVEAWLPTAESSTLTLSQVAGQLIELCDPVRLAESAIALLEKDGSKIQDHPHAIIAEQLAWSILSSSSSTHEEVVKGGKGKLYAQLLTKLHISETWSARSIKRLLFVMGHLIRIVTDKTSLTAMKKIVTTLVELDDPSQLLDTEDLIELKGKLDDIHLPDKQQSSSSSSKPTANNLAIGKAKKTISALSTVNMMDEITDLLD